MQSSSARTLRGLSIAIIVVSIIAALSCLIVGIATGGVGVIASDPDLQASVSADIDPGTSAQLDEYGLTTEDAVGLTGAFMLLGGLGMVVAGIFSLVDLIAGIMGLRGGKNAAKAGVAMVWMIVGAVTAVPAMNIVLFILCIVGAVYANKVKKEGAANFVPYGTPQQ